MDIPLPGEVVPQPSVGRGVFYPPVMHIPPPAIHPPLPSVPSFEDIPMPVEETSSERPPADDPNRYSPSGPLSEEDPVPPSPQVSQQSNRFSVLGKAKAKKRLLAFSATKQGGGAGLAFNLPKKVVVRPKSAKEFASSQVEEEKLLDGLIKKKTSKKGTSRDDKARAVVTAIEEIKREELLMRGAFRLAVGSKSPGTMTAPLPLQGLPVDLSQLAPDENKVKPATEIVDSAPVSVDRESRRSEPKRDERRSHHRKSERRSKEKRERKDKAKPKKESFKLPTSWSEVAASGLKLDDIRRKRIELEGRNRGRAREDRHKDPAEVEKELCNPFDYPSQMHMPVRVVGYRQRDKEFSWNLLQYTTTKPVIHYCLNPTSLYAGVKTRSQMFAHAKPEAIKLMNTIIESEPKAEDLVPQCVNSDETANERKSRGWYPKLDRSTFKSKFKEDNAQSNASASEVVLGEVSAPGNANSLVEDGSEMLTDNHKKGISLEQSSVVSLCADQIHVPSKWDSDYEEDLSVQHSKDPTEKETVPPVSVDIETRKSLEESPVKSLLADVTVDEVKVENLSNLEKEPQDEELNKDEEDEDMVTLPSMKCSADGDSQLMLVSEYEEFMKAVADEPSDIESKMSDGIKTTAACGNIEITDMPNDHSEVSSSCNEAKNLQEPSIISQTIVKGKKNSDMKLVGIDLETPSITDNQNKSVTEQESDSEHVIKSIKKKKKKKGVVKRKKMVAVRGKKKFKKRKKKKAKHKSSSSSSSSYEGSEEEQICSSKQSHKKKKSKVSSSSSSEDITIIKKEILQGKKKKRKKRKRESSSSSSEETSDGDDKKMEPLTVQIKKHKKKKRLKRRRVSSSSDEDDDDNGEDDGASLADIGQPIQAKKRKKKKVQVKRKRNRKKVKKNKTSSSEDSSTSDSSTDSSSEESTSSTSSSTSSSSSCSSRRRSSRKRKRPLKKHRHKSDIVTSVKQSKISYVDTNIVNPSSLSQLQVTRAPIKEYLKTDCCSPAASDWEDDCVSGTAHVEDVVSPCTTELVYSKHDGNNFRNQSSIEEKYTSMKHTTPPNCGDSTSNSKCSSTVVPHFDDEIPDVCDSVGKPLNKKCSTVKANEEHNPICRYILHEDKSAHKVTRQVKCQATNEKENEKQKVKMQQEETMKFCFPSAEQVAKVTESNENVFDSSPIRHKHKPMKSSSSDEWEDDPLKSFQKRQDNMPNLPKTTDTTYRKLINIKNDSSDSLDQQRARKQDNIELGLLASGCTESHGSVCVNEVGMSKLSTIGSNGMVTSFFEDVTKESVPSIADLDVSTNKVTGKSLVSDLYSPGQEDDKSTTSEEVSVEKLDSVIASVSSSKQSLVPVADPFVAHPIPIIVSDGTKRARKMEVFSGLDNIPLPPSNYNSEIHSKTQCHDESEHVAIPKGTPKTNVKTSGKVVQGVVALEHSQPVATGNFSRNLISFKLHSTTLPLQSAQPLSAESNSSISCPNSSAKVSEIVQKQCTKDHINELNIESHEATKNETADLTRIPALFPVDAYVNTLSRFGSNPPARRKFSRWGEPLDPVLDFTPYSWIKDSVAKVDTSCSTDVVQANNSVVEGTSEGNWVELSNEQTGTTTAIELQGNDKLMEAAQLLSSSKQVGVSTPTNLVEQKLGEATFAKDTEVVIPSDKESRGSFNLSSVMKNINILEQDMILEGKNIFLDGAICGSVKENSQITKRNEISGELGTEEEAQGLPIHIEKGNSQSQYKSIEDMQSRDDSKSRDAPRSRNDARVREDSRNSESRHDSRLHDNSRSRDLKSRDDSSSRSRERERRSSRDRSWSERDSRRDREKDRRDGRRRDDRKRNSYREKRQWSPVKDDKCRSPDKYRSFKEERARSPTRDERRRSADRPIGRQSGDRRKSPVRESRSPEQRRRSLDGPERLKSPRKEDKRWRSMDSTQDDIRHSDGDSLVSLNETILTDADNLGSIPLPLVRDDLRTVPEEQSHHLPSLPDSTVVDSELLPAAPVVARQIEKNLLPVRRHSSSQASPPSPKRISLDERLALELGVEMPVPLPVPHPQVANELYQLYTSNPSGFSAFPSMEGISPTNKPGLLPTPSPDKYLGPAPVCHFGIIHDNHVVSTPDNFPNQLQTSQQNFQQVTYAATEGMPYEKNYVSTENFSRPPPAIETFLSENYPVQSEHIQNLASHITSFASRLSSVSASSGASQRASTVGATERESLQTEEESALPLTYSLPYMASSRVVETPKKSKALCVEGINSEDLDSVLPESQNQKSERKKHKWKDLLTDKKQVRGKEIKSKCKADLLQEAEALRRNSGLDLDEVRLVSLDTALRSVNISTPPQAVVGSVVPLPEAGRGILISAGFRDEPVEIGVKKPQKSVRFADDVLPGEGTSPSGGEDMPSPPPYSSAVHKKEKKLHKKKKIKVQVIRKTTIDSSKEVAKRIVQPLPPPPPPDHEPSPALRYLVWHAPPEGHMWKKCLKKIKFSEAIPQTPVAIK